ncbi:alcohol dehydrogenase [Methylobacterium sp. DB0501]|uniref:GMC family oxidoreductase n=1 Tax=Methylobacterium sp. DB0501 TaxID=2709665 RepID=UPI0013EC4C7D|nr:GMC family oxidoreductase N-terminal domain-containing protein [Methylobacterium sp. DB0501]NGM37417.1 alcohol dehydrogenase [Methylobacterium sp. DB0501]
MSRHDTVIVGAGSAGCVLAGRLSADPARRMLLLEAGGEPPLGAVIPSDWPSLFNTGADWGFHTEPQAECRYRRIFWPRGRMLGGSGSLNAMIYLRGLPSDYDGWEAMGCPGWGWRDVLPDFLSSEDNRRFGSHPLHGTDGPLPVEDCPYRDEGETLWHDAAVAAGHPSNPDFNGGSQEGVGFFQLTTKGGERFGTKRAYLDPARERGNLTIETGVLVTRIVVEHGRAVGVEYLRNGRPERASADRIVLAAGAIASPHLMMLSGIGPADALKAVGVAPVHDLPGVGQDLQDHPAITLAFAAKCPIGLGALDGAGSFAEWQARRTGPRTSNWAAAGGHVATRPGIEPDLQLYGIASAHRDYGRFLYPDSGFTLFAVLQRPESRGEICLRSADPLSAPAIDPRYLSDAGGHDLATLVEGVRINRAIAAAGPLAGVLDHELSPSAECRDEAGIARHVRGHLASLYHPSSTCRMGIDPGDVVDPQSFAVRGLDGLFVADASVFPRMISANLNATVILVAERAARVLAD